MLCVLLVVMFAVLRLFCLVVWYGFGSDWCVFVFVVSDSLFGFGYCCSLLMGFVCVFGVLL